MARQPSRHPTELELEILKILWREGPMPVRTVRSRLEPYRKLAYTSVMTIMQIMVDKGYLSRKKTGGRFVYKTKISENKTTREMMRDLVDRAFEGSTAAAAVHLLKTDQLTTEEINQLKQLLDQKVKETK